MIIAWTLFILFGVYSFLIGVSLFMSEDRFNLSFAERFWVTVIGIILTSFPAQYIWG